MALTATIEARPTARPDAAAGTGRSTPARFFEVAAARAGRTAMRWKHLGIWQVVTWTDYAAAVRDAGLALLAHGMVRGDRVAILSHSRPEWCYADLAAQSVGCVSVGIDVSEQVAHIAGILRDCGARVLFVDGTEQLDIALAANVPTLECIVHFDERIDRVETPVRIVSFAAFCAGGRESHADRLQREMERAGLDDVAAISYEAAGGGPPKSVALSHRDLLRKIEALAHLCPGESGDEQLSILPLSRLVERCWTAYRPLCVDAIVNFGESPASCLAGLREVAPDVAMATPQTFADLEATIAAAIAEAMGIERLSYRMALSVGAAIADRQAKGLPPSPSLAVRFFLARALVLNRVKTMIGLQRARQVLCVGKVMQPALSDWYRALGVRAIEVQDEIG